jgi:hypothetical protein
VDDAALGRLRRARSAARELAWAQAIETRGALPVSTAAGRTVPGLVLDLDASIVLCHSDKQGASPTWKKSFGLHPLFCFLDATGEALSGLLRPGNAGSNTTADHITVLDMALAQIPDVHRHGTPILIRSDSAGASHGFLAHIRSLRAHGINTRFSVGVAITEPVRDAITAAQGWTDALGADGELRDAAEVCEITTLLSRHYRADYPAGTRFLVRRERPHPGAQLTLFDLDAGWRHQVIATDTPIGHGSVQPRVAQRAERYRRRRRPAVLRAGDEGGRDRAGDVLDLRGGHRRRRARRRSADQAAGEGEVIHGRRLGRADAGRRSGVRRARHQSWPDLGLGLRQGARLVRRRPGAAGRVGVRRAAGP